MLLRHGVTITRLRAPASRVPLTDTVPPSKTLAINGCTEHLRYCSTTTYYVYQLSQHRKHTFFCLPFASAAILHASIPCNTTCTMFVLLGTRAKKNVLQVRLQRVGWCSYPPKIHQTLFYDHTWGTCSHVSVSGLLCTCMHEKIVSRSLYLAHRHTRSTHLYRTTVQTYSASQFYYIDVIHVCVCVNTIFKCLFSLSTLYALNCMYTYLALPCEPFREVIGETRINKSFCFLQCIFN